MPNRHTLHISENLQNVSRCREIFPYRVKNFFGWWGITQRVINPYRGILKLSPHGISSTKGNGDPRLTHKRWSCCFGWWGYPLWISLSGPGLLTLIKHKSDQRLSIVVKKNGWVSDRLRPVVERAIAPASIWWFFIWGFVVRWILTGGLSLHQNYLIFC